LNALKRTRKLLPVIAVLFVVAAGVVTWGWLSSPGRESSGFRSPRLLGSPAPSRAGGEYAVCLDAGHGGEETGAKNGGRQEKDDTLRMALRVRDILRERGVPCVMTREQDVTVSLAERLEFVEREASDIFVSIHRNFGGGEGLEIWIKNDPSPKETEMADHMLALLLRASGLNDRGVKRGTASFSGEDYAMNKADATTCLIELGFMENETDNRLFDENFEAIATAIADGIMSIDN